MEKDFILKKVPHSDEIQLCYYSGKESVVKVPDGVTSIEPYAFADDEHPNDTITKIVLPDSVTNTEDNAFAFCRALKEIVWPDNDDFFLGINLFEGCSALEKLSIPENVTGIVSFIMPENLKVLEVHDNLEYAGQSAFTFEKCERKDKVYYNSDTIKVLLQNPNYQIIDGFMVNTKRKIALFYVDRNKKEVRVPDGIEILSLYAFDDYGYFECGYKENAYTGEKIVPVEKVILPKSVKQVWRAAFFHCSGLKSVVYEGISADLYVNEGAFDNCGELSISESKILCSDTLEKNKKTTHLMLERIIAVHNFIKSGCYPNTEKIRQFVNKKFNFYDPKEQFSISTISRDLDFLRTRFDAPLEYDRGKGGYFYSGDFELLF